MPHTKNMTKALYLTYLLVLFITHQVPAQTINPLRQKIQHIVSGKNATVGVYISGNTGKTLYHYMAVDISPCKAYLNFI